MVEAAAKLALSVLPKAYALTAAESQKALHQCKEQSSEMLEKSCRAVEQVLFTQSFTKLPDIFLLSINCKVSFKYYENSFLL